jgi:hypothetical protein
MHFRPVLCLPICTFLHQVLQSKAQQVFPPRKTNEIAVVLCILQLYILFVSCELFLQLYYIFPCLLSELVLATINYIMAPLEVGPEFAPNL